MSQFSDAIYDNYKDRFRDFIFKLLYSKWADVIIIGEDDVKKKRKSDDCDIDQEQKTKLLRFTLDDSEDESTAKEEKKRKCEEDDVDDESREKLIKRKKEMEYESSSDFEM